MKRTLWIAALLALTGCFHFRYVNDDAPTAPKPVERQHHGLVFGLVELSDPVDVPQLCPAGASQLASEETFVNGLLRFISAGIYNAQTVSLSCRAEPAAPAPAAAPPPSPPPAAAAPAPAPPPPAPSLRSQLATGRATAQGILFDSGKATLRPESASTLEEMLTLLKEEPALRLRIEGHTDDAGDAAANRKLSERRAAAVKAWLVSHGVAARRLQSAGLGASHPVAPNDTPENRARNRRVELVKLGK